MIVNPLGVLRNLTGFLFHQPTGSSVFQTQQGFNAIEATLMGLHWRELPGDIRAELRIPVKTLGLK